MVTVDDITGRMPPLQKQVQFGRLALDEETAPDLSVLYAILTEAALLSVQVATKGLRFRYGRLDDRRPKQRAVESAR